MNIAAVNSHIAYRPRYWEWQIEVDGVVAIDCIFASEEKGEALCLVCDENGIKARTWPDSPGPEMKLLTGKVVIRKVNTPATERYSRFYLNIFGGQHKIVSASQN